MDPDTAVGDSPCPDTTTASGGPIGLSHQAVPHSSASHGAQTTLLLFLSHLSTTYFLILMVPALACHYMAVGQACGLWLFSTLAPKSPFLD